MLRKIALATTIILLVPGLLFAQDGKIRGKVTDNESGEPLIGANVLVEGTSLGASTDINGEYVILGVPAGTYSAKASYIGYAAVTISNVRVSSNITTTLDFQMSSTAIQADAVDIVAERPLIQRNTTNTVRMTTSEEIKTIPFRGIQNIMALEAGVVSQDGNLHMRGGRADEVTFYLEGSNTTSPLNSAQTVPVIQEAIEEIQIQAGGYTAEVGGGNAGVVRTTLRSGTPTFKASVDYQTDEFVGVGEDWLGGTSYGFRNGVATVSGAVPGMSSIKFFVAGQYNYYGNRTQQFIEPFKFEGLRVDINDARYDNTMPLDSQALLPGAVEFKKNYVSNNTDQSISGQGTFTFDFNPFKLRVSGTYSSREFPAGTTWPRALDRIFDQRRPETNNNTVFGEAKFTHVLNPNTFYEVGASYQSITSETFDPKNPAKPTGLPAITVGGQPFTPNFVDGWTGYTDSISAAKLNPNWVHRRRFAGPFAWSTINGFQFSDPGSPVNAYAKSAQSGLGFTFDATSQISSNYELKVGARAEMWTLRNYAVNNIQGAMEYLYGINGNSPITVASQDALRVTLAKTSTGNINHYGYDVFGNEVSSGFDAPKEPFFASGYIQNKFEYEDLILNVGVRLEHFDPKAKVFSNPALPDSSFDSNLDVIDESKLVDADPFTLLLPRVSFSFPVTDNTVFYAMYGKFAQMPSLNQLYVGNTILSRTVSPASRGNAFLTPIGFLMSPQRTTQYEVGFRQSLTDNFAFTVTGFYRDMKDLLAVRPFVDDRGNSIYTAYQNEDFGTVKGLELTLELRRTSRLAAKISYTLQDALGTASNPRSAFGAIEQNIGRPTNFINPLDFNQAHRGTVSLDYRWGRGDGGPILEGLGIAALMTFNSGHNYTKTEEPRDLGQASPWTVGIRPLIDPRSSFPSEPLNASSTPWVFNIDLNVLKTFWIGDISLDVYANVLNLFNTKHILNVYPSTGTPYDDGWLTSPLATGFHDIPNYVEFYRAINLSNQYWYQRATGNQMFGSPRQVRFGIRVSI